MVHMLICCIRDRQFKVRILASSRQSMTHAQDSVIPYPCKTVTSAVDKNSCVPRLIGAPPLRANLSRPPVPSRTALKTMASVIPTNPAFLADMAKLKTADLTAPPDLTLVMIPFRINSQTAGTPTMTVGLKALISPTQFRTEVSVRVLTVPYPIGACSSVGQPLFCVAKDQTECTYSDIEHAHLDSELEDMLRKTQESNQAQIAIRAQVRLERTARGR